MLLSIVFFLLSIIPSVLIFLWLRGRHKDDVLYRKSSNSAFIRGILCVLPIVGLSGLLYVLGKVLQLTLLQNINILIYKAIYTFIVLALAEEIVKYFALRGLLKKKPYAYTRADVVAMMVIIGTAFGLAEDVPYAVGSNAMTMLVRGFTAGHIGYGFIMGWFYGKSLYTGKKHYSVIALLLPWLIHGLYDFSLSPELLEANDNFAFLAVGLAVLDMVLLILMIRFFIKSKNKEIYQTPLAPFAGALPQPQPQPEPAADIPAAATAEPEHAETLPETAATVQENSEQT